LSICAFPSSLVLVISFSLTKERFFCLVLVTFNWECQDLLLHIRVIILIFLQSPLLKLPLLCDPLITLVCLRLFLLSFCFRPPFLLLPFPVGFFLSFFLLLFLCFIPFPFSCLVLLFFLFFFLCYSSFLISLVFFSLRFC
jgi:hypothetical protein